MTTKRKFLLLLLSARLPVKKLIRYGSLITANTKATCDSVKLFLMETMGMKINPT